MYTRLFGARSEECRGEGTVNQAKQTLEAFDVVGVTEHLDVFRDRLAHEFGLDLTFRLERANPVDRTDREDQVPASLRARLEEWAAPDREIYDHARALSVGPTQQTRISDR